jgi:hypothetical protein
MDALPVSQVLMEAVLGTGLVASVLALWSARSGSPAVGIANRWARWAFIALVAAYFLRMSGVDDRPTWALIAVGGLTWMLVETLYLWMAVAAFSQSSQPLFPQYRVNRDGDEWPASRKGIRLREAVRAAGFTHRLSLVAELSPEVAVRASLFESADRLHRLQVLFLPQPSGALTACLSLATQTESGVRFITDNLFTPFGGFFPEHYHVERRPLSRRLPGLLRRHVQRVTASGEKPAVWETDPLADLNAQQRVLEQVNTELGFLVPRQEREELGKLTREGRYRIWKEIWMLHYLGVPRRYAG